MPYQVEWKNSGVYWTYTGVLTGEDILKSNFEIYGDPRFDGLSFQIVNFLNVEKFEVVERDIQKVAYVDAAAARTNYRIRVAVVARSKEAIKLKELYAKYSRGGGWPTEVFGSVEEAEAWVR